MRWLAWTLAVVTVVVGAVAVGGLLLPRTAHHERTVVVAAHRATVFAVLNGLAHTARWWPWAEAAAVSYDGPPFGVGATLRWTATGPGGRSGSQEIVVSEPFTLVATRLDLTGSGPLEATYRLTESDGSTQVAWAVTVDLGYDLVGRYAAFFAESDQLGPDLERGLGALKTLVEALPKADWTQLDMSVTEVDAVEVVTVRTRIPADQAEVWATLVAAFTTVDAAMTAAGVAPAGAPVAIPLTWGENGIDLKAGYPCRSDVDRARLAAVGLQLSTLPGGRVVEAVHAGDYAGIPLTYQRLAAFLAAHGFTPAGPPRETYLSNPAAAGADRLTTVITYPVHPPLSAAAVSATPSR